MENKFGAYSNLRDSEVGKDLTRWIDSEYDRIIKEATEAGSEEGFGLLKKASGIILVKQHIDVMASGDKPPK